MEEEQLIFQDNFIIKKIINSPVNSNCYVLSKIGIKECLIIDPGSIDNNTLNKYLQSNKLLPSSIILTHEHFDHIWGVNDLLNKYSLRLISNTFCKLAISNPKKNLSLFFDQVGFSITNKVECIETMNYELIWNEVKLKFIQTPGHSNGSISVLVDNYLFCGDLLIQGEKTVTKLPGGSSIILKHTLSKLKNEISPNVLIYSGHGKNFKFCDYFMYSKI